MKFDTYFCCDDIEELFDGDFEFSDFLEENFDNKATLSEKDFELFFDKLHQYYKNLLGISNNCLMDILPKIQEKDLKKLAADVVKNKAKYTNVDRLLNASNLIRFGLEIEFGGVQAGKFHILHRAGLMSMMMHELGIPDDLTQDICDNFDEYGKWDLTRDGFHDTEISTPILSNNPKDISELAAICTLLNGLGCLVRNTTSLQVNIDVGFLECNQKALDNVLLIWKECEELFFKMANPDGKEIRSEAKYKSQPVKGNIQKYYEVDGSLKLDTPEDMDLFLFYIQAQDRMNEILDFSKREDPIDDNAPIEEKKQRFLEMRKKYDDERGATRYTSINYTHMKWNSDSPGRIEVRFFDSTLDFEKMMQDVLFVLKIFEVSVRNAKDPSYKAEEFQRLMNHDVTERVKVGRLLDLLFDNEEEKEPFRQRWESVKNNSTYKRFESGTPTYIREEYE